MIKIPIQNSQDRFGLIAVLLHWGIALLIFCLLPLGLYMVTLPDSAYDTRKVYLVLLHKELGIWVLFLATLRLFWRWLNVQPVLPAEMDPLQKIAADLSHWALYFFQFAMPITGWLLSSAANFPAFFLGITLPHLIPYDYNQYLYWATVHKWLAFALIATISVHVAAALHHHFVVKDNILRRMTAFWR